MTKIGPMILALSAGLALGLGAQNPMTKTVDVRQAKRVQLGKFLFRTPKLSLNDTISCASCHDAGHAFAGTEDESTGILGTKVGKNSPTLVGIRHTKLFPGVTKGARRNSLRSRALSLAERCLAPIENPLEMGSSIEVAVKKIRAIPGMDQRFTEAFGGSTSPINGKRIGEALAAFLETLDIPETRFHAFLRGDQDALTPLERQGYAKFNEAGCAECHRGRNLSDGMMHPVLPPNGTRAQAQGVRAATLARAAREGKDRYKIQFPKQGTARRQYEEIVRRPRSTNDMCGPPRTSRSRGYGGQTPGVTIEVQTLPLWNVTQTAPYFRDGSVAKLRPALRQHVKELRTIQKGWPTVKERLRQLDAAGGRPPGRLIASRRKWVSMGNRLGSLEDLDLVAIEAFLAALETAPPVKKIPLNAKAANKGGETVMK